MTNSVWQAPIQNATGDIVIGAEITVIDEGTGLNATIFSTRGGAALTNPFFSDSNGFAQFYAGPGEYRIEALDNGTGLTQTLRYVRLGDSGSVDTGTATGEVPTADELNMVGAPVNFTSNNLNPNIFSVNAASDIISIGYASSSVSAVFILPVSATPVSITNVVTWQILSIGFAVRASGVIPVFDSASSDKACFITATIAGGVTGEPLYLRAESANSKITVNS